MKIQQKTSVVERSGIVQETEFKIKATSKAFSILSSGLYSNKIQAIVRELSCNAYDAHVAAGKKNVPIEVKLPNALSPSFVVKDYGTGLSHDQVINLYTTYFESTKSDSNDFIGALGLGSKSPFSYVNAFSVESRYNGTLRQYRAFLNEEGVPSISLMNETTTSEENGITISVDVKANDFIAFANAAKIAFEFFDPVPIVNGTSYTPNKAVYDSIQEKNWKIKAQVAYGETRLRVVQGLVAYPIDLHILQENGLSNDLKLIMENAAVDFFVPIGEVDVAASRERLSYDKRTCRNLMIRFHEFVESCKKLIQQELDSYDTLWEARCRALKLNNNVFQRIVRNAYAFTWKGAEYPIHFELNTDYKNVDFRLLYKSYHKKSYDTNWSSTQQSRDNTRSTYAQNNTRVKKDHFSYKIGDITDMVVVVDDTFKKGGLSRAKEHFADNHPNKNDRFHLLYIQCESSDWNTIEKVLKDQFVGAPVFYVSKLALQAKTRTAYKAKHINEVYTWREFNKGSHTYSRNVWTSLKQDLNNREATKFYVELDRFTPIMNGRIVSNLDEVVHCAKNAGVLPTAGLVFGLNKKQVAHVKNNDTWVNLFTALNEWWDKHELFLVKVENDFLEDKSFLGMYELINQRCGLFQDNLYRKFGQQVVLYASLRKRYNMKFIRDVGRVLQRNKFFEMIEQDELRTKMEYDEITSKLGVLQYIPVHDIVNDTEAVQEFADLINAKFK